MKKVFFATVWFISSCTNDDVIPRPYPRVNTIRVESIDPNGALFSGEIFYADVPVRDHGFLWSPYSNVVPGNADKVSLGSKDGAGRFEAAANWGLENGKTYYMRAYAVSDKHEVLGDIETFVAKGSAVPVIDGIFPDKATWGDTINIVGENFSLLPITNQLTLHDIPVEIVGGNKDTLRIKVPYYFPFEFSNVTITSQGQTSTSPKQLQLKAPDIQSISPASGTTGTTVTIGGLNLNSSYAKVSFNNVEAPLFDLKPNAVIVKLPAGLPSGTVQVKVVTGDGNLFDTTTFTVL
ncbi:MAG TPA: IPT/TIG domain-containing protein [Chryseolinea sp.]